jgi:hypothetical protein
MMFASLEAEKDSEAALGEVISSVALSSIWTLSLASDRGAETSPSCLPWNENHCPAIAAIGPGSPYPCDAYCCPPRCGNCQDQDRNGSVRQEADLQGDQMGICTLASSVDMPGTKVDFHHTTASGSAADSGAKVKLELKSLPLPYQTGNFGMR